ncbi:putative Hydrogenase, membrane subunit 2-like protein [[Clostridium] ultunense Esp]|nr:putative Hydrogenase, membrane subunit 2-like protein [[Clostridium] ultunense Esp]
MIEQWVAMILFGSTLLTLLIRKVADTVGVVAFQSFILSITAGVMWFRTGVADLLVAALLTLGVKALLIPFILYYTIRKLKIKKEVERYTSKSVTLMIGLALAVLGYYVTARLDLPGTALGKIFLPVSVIMIFLGTLIMINYKKAIMQGVGLITIENGLFLVSQSLSYGMPLMIELGIFFDMLVMVVIIGILSTRIQSTFDSLNTDRLTRLKG